MLYIKDSDHQLATVAGLAAGLSTHASMLQGAWAAHERGRIRIWMCFSCSSPKKFDETEQIK